jgi:prophage DNA circulation protein
MSSLSDWLDQLKQASFRGVPFGVLVNENTFGRRGEVHEYPFRDKPWFEDLGRATRRINIRGFLVSNSAVYGGGSAIDQKERLIAAVETEGTATLVHPTLGDLTVDNAVLVISDTVNAQIFEFQLSCIETGARVFPTTSANTGDATNSAADDADDAASGDFSDAATPALSLGALAQQQVSAAIAGWTGQISNLGSTATSLISLATGLDTGSLLTTFGRFANGALQGGLGAGFISPYAAATTIADLISDASSQRDAIASAGDLLEDLASTIGLGASSTSPAQVARQAQSLVAALGGANPDPGAAVVSLTSLINATVVTTPSVLSGAVGDAVRRAAITALARATTTYQPASYNDAASLRASVTSIIDNEIDIAGDQGADETFNAMRDLRSAVSQDLTARGANLAKVQNFTSAGNQPVLVIAQRLYGDASRYDELLTEMGAACPNPLFGPSSFTALAS